MKTFQLMALVLNAVRSMGCLSKATYVFWHNRQIMWSLACIRHSWCECTLVCLTSSKSSLTQRGMGVPQYRFLEMAQSRASLSQFPKRFSRTNSGTLQKQILCYGFSLSSVNIKCRASSNTISFYANFSSQVLHVHFHKGWTFDHHLTFIKRKKSHYNGLSK